MLGVVFIGVDRADGLAVVDDRRGRTAFERLVRKFGVKDVLPAKRLHKLCIKGVAADRAVSLARVVQHAARGVRHKHAGDPRLLHERHRTRDILLAPLLKARKRRHHHGDAALQRDLQASAFEEKINQSLENGYLPVVVLSQESGEYRSLGKSALWAAEYAADKVNENGGVNGCKVQIISENTNSEKSKALSLFQGASRASFLVLGPMDAPETAYIAKNVERNQTINIAAYSFAESRNTMAPYGISYMSDSEDGELEEVRMWGQQNPDIKNIVLYTMSQDESKKNTTKMFEDTLSDLGLNILKIVDVKPGADEMDDSYYAIQGLNENADGYVFLIRGRECANILVKLRQHGIEEGRRISVSFSAYGSEFFEIAGDMLDGVSIWHKFDPFYSGTEWQQLLKDYEKDKLNTGSAEQMPNPVVDYYDAVQAICKCYEQFGITSENYEEFIGNADVVQWFYNSEFLEGIQSDFRWQEGQKITDYQFFVFEGETPVNRKVRP